MLGRILEWMFDIIGGIFNFGFGLVQTVFLAGHFFRFIAVVIAIIFIIRIASKGGFKSLSANNTQSDTEEKNKTPGSHK